MARFTAALALVALVAIGGASAAYQKDKYDREVRNKVNEYGYVTESVPAGSKQIQVLAADIERFHAGDHVVLHQTKSGIATPGYYEENIVMSVSRDTGTVYFKFETLEAFHSGAPDGTECDAEVTQVVSYPQWDGNTIIKGKIGGKAFDGRSGGIIMMVSTGLLTVGEDSVIVASGIGFRGCESNDNAYNTGCVGESVCSAPHTPVSGTEDHTGADGGGGSGVGRFAGGGGGNTGRGQNGDGFLNYGSATSEEYMPHVLNLGGAAAAAATAAAAAVPAASAASAATAAVRLRDIRISGNLQCQ